MGHAGFREVLKLAACGVPWNIATSWSPQRREAALAILLQERVLTDGEGSF